MLRVSASLALSVLVLLSTFLPVTAVPVILDTASGQLERRTITLTSLARQRIAIAADEAEAWLYIGQYNAYRTTVQQQEGRYMLIPGRVENAPRHYHILPERKKLTVLYANYTSEKMLKESQKQMCESILDSKDNWDFIFKAIEWMVGQGIVWEGTRGEEGKSGHDKGIIPVRKITELPEVYKKERDRRPHGAAGAELPASTGFDAAHSSPSLSYQDLRVEILNTGQELVLFIGLNAFRAGVLRTGQWKVTKVEAADGFGEGRVKQLQLQDGDRQRGDRKNAKASNGLRIPTSGAVANFQDGQDMKSAFDKICALRAISRLGIIEKAVKVLVDAEALLDLKGMVYTPEMYRNLNWGILEQIEPPNEKRKGNQPQSLPRQRRKGNTGESIVLN